jgi:two-component system chemotaxis response regulator CheY
MLRLRPLWTLDFGLWTSDFGLRTLDFGLWTLDFGLWTLDRSLSPGFFLRKESYLCRVNPCLRNDVRQSKTVVVNFISPRTAVPIAPGALLSLTPEPASNPAGPHIPKILIADDSVVVLKALSIKIKSAGYEVRTALDGSTAISCVRRDKPDLIILDINFPPDVARGGGISWDGFLILDWLRRIDEVRDTPIIFITSAEPAKFREKALAAGAVAFFQKPVNPEEMLGVIRHIVGEPPEPSHSGSMGF